MSLNYIQKYLDIRGASYLVMMKGIAISRLEMVDCIEDYYTLAADIDDDKTIMKHLYAKENILSMKYDKALLAYKDLIKIHPNSSKYFSEASEIFLVQKNYDLALEYLDTAYKLNWNDKTCLKDTLINCKEII